MLCGRIAVYEDGALFLAQSLLWMLSVGDGFGRFRKLPPLLSV
jgi:hypothetical protein